MRMFRTASLAAMLTCASLAAACGASIPMIVSTVVSVVDEVLDWVDTIDRVVGERVPETHRGEFDKLVLAVKAAAEVAQNLARGTENLSQEDVAEAFDDLRDAYLALLKFTEIYGVRPVPPGEQMGLHPDFLGVPAPDDLVPRS